MFLSIVDGVITKWRNTKDTEQYPDQNTKPNQQ